MDTAQTPSQEPPKFDFKQKIVPSKVEEGHYMSKGKKKRSKEIDELHEVAFEGDATGLRELLQQGADPNVKNPRNETPLHVAMARGKVLMIEPLIKHGANPNKMPYHGLTALMLAIMNGHPACVRKLLEACRIHKVPLNINQQHLLGETALHYAAAVGDAKSIQALIEAGADINKQGIDGRTPLAVAETNQQRKAVKVLKQYGGIIKPVTVVPHPPRSSVPDFIKQGVLDDATQITVEDKYGGVLWTSNIIEAFYTGKKPKIGLAVELRAYFDKDFQNPHTFTQLRGLISSVADDKKSFKATVELIVDHKGEIPELDGEWEATLTWDTNLFKKVPCPWMLTSLVPLTDTSKSIDTLEKSEIERIINEGYRVAPIEPEPCWILKGSELLKGEEEGEEQANEEAEAEEEEEEEEEEEIEYGDEDIPPKIVVSVQVDTKANTITYIAEDGDTKTMSDERVPDILKMVLEQNEMIRQKGTGVSVIVDGKDIYAK